MLPEGLSPDSIVQHFSGPGAGDNILGSDGEDTYGEVLDVTITCIHEMHEVEFQAHCNMLTQLRLRGGGDPGTDGIGEERCARFIAEFLEASGAEAFLDEVEPGRPNVIGRFPTNPSSDGAPKPRILFAPHTDTVSVGGMTIDPFGGELREGKIWGRGASDTKGPMASFLWALHEMRDEIPNLPVEVHFVGFMSEESAQLGSQHFAKHHGRYDLAIIGEPTSLKTVFRHKGCLWADVHTSGVAVHGATPELGVNAIVKMAKLVAALDSDFRELLAEASGADEWLGVSESEPGRGALPQCGRGVFCPRFE
jgi:acetylornithine deacetylase/succinyl-diaminopimelate desuccinylase-like protein